MKDIFTIILAVFLGSQSLFGASIEGKVWQDLDENHLKEISELGVPNVIIYLLAHPSGDTLQTTQSDGSGLYVFTGLAAGDFRLAVDLASLPIGLREIADINAPGSWDVTVNCDFHPTGLGNQLVLPNASLQITNIDLGLLVTPTALLSGMAWEDVNGNDIRDAGDTEIQNIFVALIDENGLVVHLDTTDALGQYAFLPAELGDYTVQFDPTSYPENLFPVAKDAGSDDLIDSDVYVSGITATIDLQSDINNIDLGLGSTPSTESLGGKVWYDGNNNGLFEMAEVGVPNVFVRLFDEADIEIAKDTTDVTGLYEFLMVEPGNYYVEFDTSSFSSSYIVVAKDTGNNDGIDSDASADGKTDLIAFTTSLTNVFLGVYAPPTTGAVNGKVWKDSDFDNLYTFGESLIEGVSVFLIDAIGDTVTTEVTNISGQYAFANIEPANYKIAFGLEVLPAGFSIVTMDFGSDDSVDSDVDTFGVSNFITIIAGNTANFIDLGYTTPLEPVSMTNETLNINVDQNSSVSICLDTTELQGILDNAHICIAPLHGEATDFTDNCFTYFPDLDYVGLDSFCVVVCDENACDTTILNINILELVSIPPVAINDIDTVVQGVPAQLMVLSNDTLFAAMVSLNILEFPTLGSAIVDTFGFIRYMPEPNICDETVSLTYEVCTQFGCDTATVEVFLDCNNINIVEGFSPNSDGINDTFVIKGISEYPNNTLTIFNRWGNQVLKQEKYDNLWEGYWSDKNTYLPSGTYFYIFDTGDGGRMTGSFEMMR